MEEENKLPLKRVELSLSKFNEVAIPHHLDLLRQHKANIVKYGQVGSYARVRAEQTNARRVAAQLRSLLGELDALRRQVRSQDLDKFDQLTRVSRDLTLKAIMDYLDIIESGCRLLVSEDSRTRTATSPLAMSGAPPARCATTPVSGSVLSTDSVGVVHDDDVDVVPLVGDDVTPVQLQIDETVSVTEREAVLRGWCELQGEVRALHEAWRAVHDAALTQREHIDQVAHRTDLAADNVQAASGSLALAERLRAGAYGAGGAVVGALVGGPVGLAVGAKAGAAAGLAGSLIGYLGARLLGRQRQLQIDTGARDKDD